MDSLLGTGGAGEVAVPQKISPTKKGKNVEKNLPEMVSSLTQCTSSALAQNGQSQFRRNALNLTLKGPTTYLAKRKKNHENKFQCKKSTPALYFGLQFFAAIAVLHTVRTA